MLNVIELENRWKRYKIKSFLPHAVIFLSVIFIGSVAYSFLSTKNLQTPLDFQSIAESQPKVQNVVLDQTVHTEHNNSLKINENKGQEKEVPLQQNKISLQSEKSKIKLEPSMDFFHGMNNNLPYYQNYNIPNEPAKENKTEKEMVSVASSAAENVILNNTIPEEIEKPQSIKIQRKDTHDDILQVIQRFKKSNDPALSLFVAKKYYELGDYHKSYNYALITNELNNNIEASWIIFAKSLVKLNEKEMAIKTLRQYIEHSSSNQAKMLLEEIRTGKFK